MVVFQRLLTISI